MRSHINNMTPMLSDWFLQSGVNAQNPTRRRFDFPVYYGSMHIPSRAGFATAYVFLSLIVLFVPPLPALASSRAAAGHFEVYCDGVGLFLAKIDGAPGSGKLVLFSLHLGGTFGGKYIGQGRWSDVHVFRDGCVPDGKCQSVADGRVWI